MYSILPQRSTGAAERENLRAQQWQRQTPPISSQPTGHKPTLQPTAASRQPGFPRPCKQVLLACLPAAYAGSSSVHDIARTHPPQLSAPGVRRQAAPVLLLYITQGSWLVQAGSWTRCSASSGGPRSQGPAQGSEGCQPFLVAGHSDMRGTMGLLRRALAADAQLQGSIILSGVHCDKRHASWGCMCGTVATNAARWLPAQPKPCIWR